MLFGNADVLSIYTDGACFPNPGVGGWAWIALPSKGVLRKEETGSGQVPNTTSQRMELVAAIEALRFAQGRPTTIFSDSRYLVSCFTEKWYVHWLSHDWRTKARKPVANRDLWEELILFENVKYQWVKGHSGNEWNEKADKLAGKAARSSRAPTTRS